MRDGDRVGRQARGFQVLTRPKSQPTNQQLQESATPKTHDAWSWDGETPLALGGYGRKLLQPP